MSEQDRAVRFLLKGLDDDARRLQEAFDANQLESAQLLAEKVESRGMALKNIAGTLLCEQRKGRPAEPHERTTSDE